jgi:uncharacterized membrane protein YozB (DUF420 family)/cytochrome oxidase Cu insertion factor (SCO1/SenC/PrrC family)
MRPSIVGLVPAICLVLACAASQATASELWPLPEFALRESGGRTIRLADLRSKVWVASFTFTRCTGACWQINETMSRLQRDFAGERDFLLVTISVDPEHDTPEIQQRFAQQRGAQPGRWLFLSGSEEEVYRLIREGFRLKVVPTEGPDRKPGFEVDHTPKVALVDRRGHLRGFFDGRQTDDSGASVDELPALKQAILSCLREDKVLFIASFNALLNATCVLLLLTGYVAIRNRKETFHKVCMLTAVGVSAVFLASYLYLHIVVKQGEPTRFGDRHPDAYPWLATVYYTVLGTHTVLAAIATPLVLVQAYLGLRDRRERHRRLARWTLPIWLYVSVTGVVVYWMLYQM